MHINTSEDSNAHLEIMCNFRALELSLLFMNKHCSAYVRGVGCGRDFDSFRVHVCVAIGRMLNWAPVRSPGNMSSAVFCEENVRFVQF